MGQWQNHHREFKALVTSAQSVNLTLFYSTLFLTTYVTLKISQGGGHSDPTTFEALLGPKPKNITIFLTPKTTPKNDQEWSEMIRSGQE